MSFKKGILVVVLQGMILSGSVFAKDKKEGIRFSAPSQCPRSAYQNIPLGATSGYLDDLNEILLAEGNSENSAAKLNLPGDKGSGDCSLPVAQVNSEDGRLALKIMPRCNPEGTDCFTDQDNGARGDGAVDAEDAI